MIAMSLADWGLFSASALLSAAAYGAMGACCPLTRYLLLWPFSLLYLAFAYVSWLQQGGWCHPNAALAPVSELRTQFISITVTYLVLFSYLTLSRRAETYSRVALCCSLCLNLLMVPLMHSAMRWLLGKLRWTRLPVLVAGAGQEAQSIARILTRDTSLGMAFVGFMDDTPGAHVLGALSEADDIAAQTGVDYLIVCPSSKFDAETLQALTRTFRHVLLVDAGFKPSLLNARFCNLNGVIGLEVSNGLLEPFPRLIKTLFESVLALALLLLLWPLFLVLAIIVKLTSRGPVFYRSTRLGLNGKTIHVIKFRTMKWDADSQLERILSESPEKAHEWQEHFKLTDDPRITAVGNFLRKTSLDELPQCWNVLTGDMAFIGPRPIVREEIPKYGTSYELLKRVRPGMTGLWQVSGRSRVSYAQRVALDVHYIMNWSIWLDYYILLKTIPEVIFCRGAR